MAQQVASAGYTVITIDHPYDADIVTFPDNRTITEGSIYTDTEELLALNTRAKDISFILNTLASHSGAKKLFPGLTSGIDVSRVGIFGHSIGGAAAAEAMLYDSRLVGGINLDGSFMGKVVRKGLKQPFLIFGHEGKDTTADPSWEAIWPELGGWKRELMLKDSQHYTFSDLPDLIDVLGIGASLPVEVEQELGTIDGGRALEIVTKYVATFFDFVLNGRKSTLLDGPTLEYPEVSFGSP
jgi:pimeloyl-ACP methyl ester carboxylesterase